MAFVFISAYSPDLLKGSFYPLLPYLASLLGSGIGLSFCHGVLLLFIMFGTGLRLCSFHQSFVHKLLGPKHLAWLASSQVWLSGNLYIHNFLFQLLRAFYFLKQRKNNFLGFVAISLSRVVYFQLL